MTRSILHTIRIKSPEELADLDGLTIHRKYVSYAGLIVEYSLLVMYAEEELEGLPERMDCDYPYHPDIPWFCIAEVDGEVYNS